jgi:hypothetical protein
MFIKYIAIGSNLQNRVCDWFNLNKNCFWISAEGRNIEDNFIITRPTNQIFQINLILKGGGKKLKCILENGFEYIYTSRSGFISQIHIDASLRFDWPANQIQLKANGKILHEKTDIIDVYNETINVELSEKEVTSFIRVYRAEPKPFRRFRGSILFKDQQIPIEFWDWLKIYTVKYVLAKKFGKSENDLEIFKSGKK